MDNVVGSVEKIDVISDVTTAGQPTGLSAEIYTDPAPYRILIDSRISFRINVKHNAFVYFDGSVSVGNNDLTSNLYIDGKREATVSLKGRGVKAAVAGGGFVEPGNHIIDIVYNCSIDPCVDEIRQYGGSLSVVKLSNDAPDRQRGPRTKELFLDAVDSKIKVSGIGEPRFDGNNIYYPMPNGKFRMSWREGNIIGTKFYIYPKVSSKIEIKDSNDKTLFNDILSDQGKTIEAFVEQKDASYIDVNIICKLKNEICSQVYFVKMYVDTTPRVEISQYVGASLLVMLSLAVLYRFVFDSPIGGIPNRHHHSSEK
ncbi:hypothetical protein [Deinococcus sedimenti]|uniref:Uncharacterized protein n=1 Tax=Deinococcus sedimenti TaxID=1867090 RepID=A0ABQ2S781_9DEIO|nr:hypothetical protein [Deinococcus sedimenti]GGR96231.1 hypothetical protein GCM10008960_23800 [Deinococcus sedimenti]